MLLQTFWQIFLWSDGFANSCSVKRWRREIQIGWKKVFPLPSHFFHETRYFNYDYFIAIADIGIDEVFLVDISESLYLKLEPM